MTATIDDVIAGMRHALKSARDIADAAEKGARDLTDDERAQITGFMKTASDLKAQADRAKADDKIREGLKDLGDSIGLVERQDGEKNRTPSGLIVPDGQKSLGQHWVESAMWQNLLKRHNGHFGEKNRIQTDALGFKNLVPKRGAKSVVTGASDTSAGALVFNQWLGLVNGLAQFERPLRLRDVITNGTTTSDTVEYAKIASITNNAAPVAEATTADLPTTVTGGVVVNPAGGGYKPESAFTTVRETAVVKTIAHWIPVTKRALSDAAQIRTLIDSFLEYGLEEELEDQIVAGDGTGENFTGIANVSGTQSQAWNTDFFTTTRKALTKVWKIGRAKPNAWLLNPDDVESLDLLKDNEGRYYFGGPNGAGSAQALWNVPIVQSEAIPAGTGYVGDWTKAILWDREQSAIQVTDSHGDFFVRNLVAILAEMRAAFGVIQPNAFVEIDLTA